MYRRIISFALVLTALLLFTCPALAAPAVSPLLSQPQDRPPMDMAAVNGVLYLYLPGEGIRVCAADAQQPGDLLLSSEALHALLNEVGSTPDSFQLLGEDHLYGWDGQHLWRYEDAQQTFRLLFTLEGALLTEELAFCSDFFVWNDQLYFLGYRDDLAEVSLFTLSADRPQPQKLLDQVLSAAPYDEHTLTLVVRDAALNDSLALLDLQRRQLSQQFPLSGDAGQKLLYSCGAPFLLWSARAIAAVDASQPPADAALFPEPERQPLECALLSQEVFAVNYGDRVYLGTLAPEQLQQRALRIRGYSARLPFPDFAAAHPEIPLQLDETPIDSALDLASDIVSGTGADIYLLSSDVFDPALFHQKDYFADLAQEPVLREAVQQMYPILRDAVCREGQIVALPCRLASPHYLLSCMPEAFARIGWTSEQLPRTYDQLISFIEQWQRGEFSEDLPLLRGLDGRSLQQKLLYGVLYEEVLRCEAQGLPIVLQPDLVAPLLERILQLQLDQLPAEPSPELAFFSTYDLALEKITSYRDQGLLPMPLSIRPEDAPVTPVRADLIFINPNTRQMDHALTCARFLWEQLPLQEKAALCAGWSEVLEDPYAAEQIPLLTEEIAQYTQALENAAPEAQKELTYALTAAQEELELLTRTRYLVGPEALELYHTYAQYLALTPHSALFDRSNASTTQLMDRLFARQIPPAQFVQEINRILSMMQAE